MLAIIRTNLLMSCEGIVFQTMLSWSLVQGILVRIPKCNVFHTLMIIKIYLYFTRISNILTKCKRRSATKFAGPITYWIFNVSECLPKQAPNKSPAPVSSAGCFKTQLTIFLYRLHGLQQINTFYPVRSYREDAGKRRQNVSNRVF